MSAGNIKKQPILFPNNNEAAAIFPSAKEKPEDIAAALGLKPHNSVIIILGGADNLDEKLTPRLTQLFSRGIARAAIEAGSIIIDGGTQAGVMTLMGEGVAARGNKTPLVGVAPKNKISYPGSDPATGVPLEPNHSHFILVEGNDWGSETSSIFNLVNVLTGEKETTINDDGKAGKQGSGKVVSKVSGVAILAGGGPVTKNEVLRAVRQNLPIIVVEGSGGLADEIAAARKNKDTQPEDPALAEIIADGELHWHQLNNSVKGIERLIIRELGTDKVLMQAWETFADYDLNANLQQKKFNKLQLSILCIGVIGTALVIIQQIWAPKDSDTINLLPLAELWKRNEIVWWTLHMVLIIVPITLTVLVTAANRFKQGSKWLLLRAGAESIKREIYRYRVRAQNYAENPEQVLAQKVEDVTRRTMRTEVNLSALKSYDKDKGFPPYMFAAKGGDDGFSYLTPDRYVEVRLDDQLRYFKKSSVKLERQLKLLYWGTFIIGGVGTFLAATGQQIWIALTTSVVAAFGTYLAYRQTENTLTKYNQAATDLANVKAWWNALSSEEQASQQNINLLAEHTEQVLQSELDGWVQQMQNALAELRKEQETPSGKKEEAEEEEPTKPGEEKNNKPGNRGEEATDKTGKDDTAASNENKTDKSSSGKEATGESESETAAEEDKETNPDEQNEKNGDGKETGSSSKEKDND